MKKYTFFIMVLTVLFGSCEPKKEQGSKEEVMAETEKANKFFDEVYDAYIDRHPMDQSYLGIKKDYDKWNDISDSNDAKEIEIVKLNLARLKKEINFDKLDEQAKLSYRLFEYNGKDQLEGFKWRYHNYPINQLFGLHSEVPSFLINIHQIGDSGDAAAYISRISRVPSLFDQLIQNAQTRDEKGIMPPKFVFGKVLDDCKNIVKGYPFENTKELNSVFQDFKSKLLKLSITEEQKKVFIDKAESALKKDFFPAYNKLIIYLSNLEQSASSDDGAWKLPNGKEYYQYALRHITTTNMTPDEVFDLGVKEVKRIHNEMKKIMKEVNFEGDDLREFFKYMRENKEFYYSNDSVGKKAYLARSVEIIDSMRGQLDALFITKPQAKLVVKAVESYREQSAAGAFYQEPAPDGSRPGIYYANLYDMSAMPKYEMEALCYHEAIPGHHMQLSIAQELKGIPKFRRYGGNTAYIEGWGLYSEAVPKEIGFYSNPYSDFGRLSKELFRACRLVVDVGIHWKKWTRSDAITYLLMNTPNSQADSEREIDRYIVWPGQATAYKIGMYKIMELRGRAKDKLKGRYNIRDFHEVVLKNGALPLNLLEENIDEFISRVSS